MVKDLMNHLRTRVAAALVGATVAMAGMGAAGALSAPIQFVGSFGDDADECVTVSGGEGAEAEAPDDEATPPCDDRSDDETVDDDVDALEPDAVSDEPVSPETSEAPTTASEAAHIHDFDEACGNHGSYVSHVARFGEEPECATDARSGASQDEVDEADKHSSEADDDAVEDEAADDGGNERQTARSNSGRGKHKD